MRNSVSTANSLQANLGAKNHATVMPDADKDATINAIIGAAFGAAGQRYEYVKSVSCFSFSVYSASITVANGESLTHSPSLKLIGPLLFLHLLADAWLCPL